MGWNKEKSQIPGKRKNPESSKPILEKLFVYLRTSPSFHGFAVQETNKTTSVQGSNKKNKIELVQLVKDVPQRPLLYAPCSLRYAGNEKLEN